MTHSHTTAECGSLSGSEREELFVRLRSIYLGKTSVEELKTVKQGQPAEALFNTLQPVPSQLLNVDYEGKKLTITLDSGATVSFCSPALVQRLGLTLQPNSQLALLADSRFRVKSKGEVDFLVVEETMVPKGARASERGLTGPPGARCRVAPQSQIHIGTDQKNTIFALFWPENASN